ncbi:MAG: DNA repair protein RecO [Myxococcales bacterium]|nr:DNA repair protein RecO [Myxococcales bacterium]MCB9702648.1 DNA repair protein RecO [Myxococcales bacterium]
MSGGPAEVVPAIVLRTRPLGDADLLVVLLTPGAGKVEAAAARARGSKRRFVGGIHPGMIGEATLARGRGALLRLGAFEATRSHAPVGQDLTRFAFVAYVCELCDELVLPRQEDPRIFAELARTLRALIEGDARASELRRFELALLDALGLLPAFGECCVCGAAIAGEPHVAFDGERGGALCPAHAGPGPRLAGEVLALAGGLVDEGDVDAVEAAAPGARRALRDLSLGLLRAHLRRPLRSLAFLAQLPRVGSG